MRHAPRLTFAACLLALLLPLAFPAARGVLAAAFTDCGAYRAEYN